MILSRRFDAQQVALVLAIMLFHGLLLYLLLLLRPPARRDAVLDRVVMLVAHPARQPDPPPAPPPPPPPSASLRDVAVVLAAPTIAIAPDLRAPSAAPAETPGAGCAIEHDIAGALASDARARAALATIGPARADTGAINLWNGDWVVPRDLADRARLAMLESDIRAAIAGAAVACGEAEQIGPRLIAVPDQARPVLLVIGSGRWHWRDLMRDAQGAF